MPGAPPEFQVATKPCVEPKGTCSTSVAQVVRRGSKLAHRKGYANSKSDAIHEPFGMSTTARKQPE